MEDDKQNKNDDQNRRQPQIKLEEDPKKMTKKIQNERRQKNSKWKKKKKNKMEDKLKDSKWQTTQKNKNEEKKVNQYNLITI